MTVFEIISDYPGLSNLGETTILRKCIDRGIDSDAVYTTALMSKTDLVIADCLIALVNLPDFSEMDLNETMSREKIIESANRIYRKYNDSLNITQPTLRSRNLW